MTTIPSYSPRIDTADAAIARSISHQEIVHLVYASDYALDLLAACDDSVEDGPVTQYWGTTDDGDEWRVHLHSGPDETL